MLWTITYGLLCWGTTTVTRDLNSLGNHFDFLEASTSLAGSTSRHYTQILLLTSTFYLTQIHIHRTAALESQDTTRFSLSCREGFLYLSFVFSRLVQLYREPLWGRPICLCVGPGLNNYASISFQCHTMTLRADLSTRSLNEGNEGNPNRGLGLTFFSFSN